MNYYENNELQQLLQINDFTLITKLLKNKKLIDETNCFLLLIDNNFNNKARIFLSIFLISYFPFDIFHNNDYEHNILLCLANRIISFIKNKTLHSENNIIKIYFEKFDLWKKQDEKTFKQDLIFNYNLINNEIIFFENNKELENSQKIAILNELNSFAKNLEKIFYKYSNGQTIVEYNEEQNKEIIEQIVYNEYKKLWIDNLDENSNVIFACLKELREMLLIISSGLPLKNIIDKEFNIEIKQQILNKKIDKINYIKSFLYKCLEFLQEMKINDNLILDFSDEFSLYTNYVKINLHLRNIIKKIINN